jgi:hypothetical protein
MAYRFQRWKSHIEGAQSEAELVTVLTEYCATFLPSDLAQLPEDCPPCMLEAPEDIPARALDFTRCELKAQHGTRAADLLHEIALSFKAASEKLGRLRQNPRL